MGAIHDRRKAILHHPPIESRLWKYLNDIECQSGPEPDWQCAMPEVRNMIVKDMLRSAKKRSQFPLEFVREHIVLPALREKGMPEGLHGDWLNELVDLAVEQEHRESLALEAQNARLPSGNKGGHPPAPYMAKAVVFAAYLDERFRDPDQEHENRWIERAATRLSGKAPGSSIGRATVRRVAEAKWLVMSSLTDDRRLRVLRAHQVVLGFMQDFDRRHPTDRAVFSNPKGPSDFSRTSEPLTFRRLPE